MSIQTELALLQNTKKENRNAIMDRGVTVSSDLAYAEYPSRIALISTTSGDKDTLFRSLVEKTITSLDIPEGTESLRPWGLYKIQTLQTVTIPSSVKTIGGDAFVGCSNLQSITCLATTPPTFVRRGQYTPVPFDNTNNCPIYVPFESVDAYKTAWPNYASRIQGFSPYTLFNSIVDRSVTSLDIPEGVQKIRQYAFSGCSSLATITIPSTVTSIGQGAFGGCTSLTTVTCLATTPPTFNDGFVSQVLTAINVPAASVSAYQSTYPWSYYSSIIQAIP